MTSQREFLSSDSLKRRNAIILSKLNNLDKEVRELMRVGLLERAQKVGSLISTFIKNYKGEFSWTVISCMVTNGRLASARGDWGQAVIHFRTAMDNCLSWLDGDGEMQVGFVEAAEGMVDFYIAVVEKKADAKFVPSNIEDPLEAALASLYRCVNIRSNILSPEHPDTKIAQYKFVYCYEIYKHREDNRKNQKFSNLEQMGFNPSLN